MGEFYPLYCSEVIINEKVFGSRFEVTDFAMKEICRNDTHRTLRLEFFEIKQVKEQDTPFYMAEFDFSLEYLKKHFNKYMNCFSGRSNVGKVKLCNINFNKKM